jgi:hypothetical protein
MAALYKMVCKIIFRIQCFVQIDIYMKNNINKNVYIKFSEHHIHEALSLPLEALSLLLEALSLPHETLSLPHETLSLPHEALSLPHETLSLPHEALSLPLEALSLPQLQNS